MLKKAYRLALKQRADELVRACERLNADMADKGGPYVVYQLVDPRDKKPFYIGSGTQGRPYQHLANALDGESGPKADRIREIVRAGLSLGIEILAVTKGRNVAYDVEETIIKSTPELLNTKHRKENPDINLRDEFCAALIMLEPYRKQRLQRIARTFKDEDAKPYPGHLTILNAARNAANGR